MAWHYTDFGRTELDHDGAPYVVRDMGGDGHCLFRSLALVLPLAGAGPVRHHGQLRGYAVETLINWVLQDVPDWFDTAHYETPDEARIGHLVSGDQGDLTCMLAVLANAYADTRISVLNASGTGGPDEYVVDLVAAGIDVAHHVRVLWVGGNHYVAVVPKVDEGGIQAVSAQLVQLEPADAPSQFSAKLSTVSGLSSALNTAQQAGMGLEIHQISVGVGDAALILLKRKGAYVQSILVDSGQFPNAVTGYFDDLISRKRFRPVDIFIASHYDKDHIGAAPTVLQDKRYASPGLVLYDSGEPAKGDSDYAQYKLAFGEALGGQRRLPDLEVPLFDEAGLTVRIVAMNGLHCGDEAGYYQSTNEAIEELVDKRLLSGHATRMQWMMAGLTPQDLFPVDKNVCSLAVLVQFHAFSYFTAGDLHGDTEDAVARHVSERYLGGGHLCACKLNHHGAHEASSPALLSLLRPRLCLVSCGTPNVHGHPSEITLQRVAQLNAVYPSQVLVAADLDVAATSGGFPWARSPLPGSAAHTQGSVVLLMDSSMVSGKQHGFMVVSTAQPEPSLCLCGERSGQAPAIVDSHARHTLSDDRKRASQRRKRQRESDRQASEREAVETVRLQMLEGLSQAVRDLGLSADQEQLLLQQIRHEVALLAPRFVHEDETVQTQRVRTLVKNFSKHLLGLGLLNAEEVHNYLANQRAK